jgi:hypothetical protein
MRIKDTFVEQIDPETGEPHYLRVGCRGGEPLWYQATLAGFDLVFDDEELEAHYQALKETA